MKPNLLFINSITIYGGGEVWMITAMKEYISKGYKATLVCKKNAAIIKHAKEAGIETVTLNISGDLNPITIYRLVKIFKEKKVNVVIANTGKDLRLSGIAVLLKGNIKVIARQGIDYPLKNNLRYRLAYKHLASVIVANSEATKKTLLKNAPWLDPDKVKVIYNGINPNIYTVEKTNDLRGEFGFAAEDFIIGFVGRLSVQKGIEYGLEGFKIVVEKHNRIKFLICGDGELRSEIEKFISENNLGHKIYLAGFRKDIPDIMRTIDVLLVPSLWEGFGIVLIEAMSSGKPCVGTKTSSIPEIIEDGVNGFLVPAKDSQSIAESLIRLISDPQIVRRFGKAGIDSINEKFTINRMINEYEKLF